MNALLSTVTSFQCPPSSIPLMVSLNEEKATYTNLQRKIETSHRKGRRKSQTGSRLPHGHPHRFLCKCVCVCNLGVL